MVLSVLGMVWARRCWREHALICAAFLDCVVVTAVFFGHTSHRLYLDVSWIAYAAHVVWPPDWVRLDQMDYTFDGGKRFLGRLICEGETHEV